MPSTAAAPPLEPQLQLDLRLCFSLYAASLAATQVYKPLLGELGLTYPQFLVLMVLWEEGSASVGRIAGRLFQSPAAITPMVKRLEQAGLVSRERDQQDERLVNVVLTDAGQALRQRAAGVSDQFAQTCAISAEQAGALREQLVQLGQRLRDSSAA